MDRDSMIILGAKCPPWCASMLNNKLLAFALAKRRGIRGCRATILCRQRRQPLIPFPGQFRLWEMVPPPSVCPALRTSENFSKIFSPRAPAHERKKIVRGAARAPCACPPCARHPRAPPERTTYLPTKWSKFVQIRSRSGAFRNKFVETAAAFQSRRNRKPPANCFYDSRGVTRELRGYRA